MAESSEVLRVSISGSLRKAILEAQVSTYALGRVVAPAAVELLVQAFVRMQQ